MEPQLCGPVSGLCLDTRHPRVRSVSRVPGRQDDRTIATQLGGAVSYVYVRQYGRDVRCARVDPFSQVVSPSIL